MSAALSTPRLPPESSADTGQQPATQDEDLESSGHGEQGAGPREAGQSSGEEWSARPPPPELPARLLPQLLPPPTRPTGRRVPRLLLQVLRGGLHRQPLLRGGRRRCGRGGLLGHRQRDDTLRPGRHDGRVVRLLLRVLGVRPPQAGRHGAARLTRRPEGALPPQMNRAEPSQVNARTLDNHHFKCDS